MTTERGHDFASDNHAGAHPEVIEAITRANEGHADSYGADGWTAHAEELFRTHFGPGARAFAVFNGTAANVLSIDALTSSGDAVICAETAHLNVDECGAPERIAGVKLLTVATEHGKLSPADLARWDARRGDEHHVQPRVVSITQASELGTVYTLEETRAIAAAAHEREMLLHLDGARLANAAASLGASLAELTTDAGVDVLSFGGTKNGLLLGDAVVFLRPELAEGFEFTRKQGMQLASKMRFVSAQFEALLDGDLWLRNRHQRQRDGRPPRRRGRGDRRGRDHPAGRGQRRLRPPAASGDRQAPGRPPRRAPLLHLGRGLQRGPLDVLVGHDRGGRRRVRGSDRGGATVSDPPG